jgi:DHA3 family macrolide efflux protein-like MFS transporter
MIRALKKPQLLRLWFGQAFSSVGDEIYRVGLIWLAVSLMGPDTGYLAAGQTASLMILSLIGGRWADQWNPRRTMITVDLIRAAIVLVPVAISFFMPNPLFVLWIMAFSLAGLSAFFDPATQGLIPILAEDTETMLATNGLMSTTIRMARMIGPAIVGLLSAFIPMIHFFTIDAFTFFVSAYCVFILKKYIPETSEPTVHKVNFKKSVMAGFELVKSVPGMDHVFIAKAFTAGTWNLVLMIGFPLLVHEVTGGDARYFGLVMASYGVGNFIGALYFGNQERKSFWKPYFGGEAFLGLGFVAIGLAPTVNLIILAAAIAGFSGPMNDLAFIDMIQQKFKVGDITKMFRLRLAVESSATLFFTLISPWLIRSTSVRFIIIAGGVTWLICGFSGLVVKNKF